MSILFNGTDVNTTYEATYNGTSLEKIVYNGTTVLEKGFYLYKYGNMCTENSGGWEYVKYLARGYLDGNTSITYNSDCMTMFAIHTGGGNNGDSSLYTKNKIDLSKYSKLCMRVSGYCYGTDISDANAVIFNTLPSTNSKYTYHRLLRITNDYPLVLTMDISDINIQCNIGFWVYAVSGNLSKYLPLTGGTMTGTITLQNSSTRCIDMNVTGDSVTTKGRFVASTVGISMSAYPDNRDTKNYRLFSLRNTSNTYPDISRALYLAEYVDGVGTTYDVYTKANLIFSLSGTTLTITTKV